MLRDVHPDGVLIKRVLVRVEALQGVFVSRVFAIHGGIMLMTEDDARAWYALSGSFCALSAYRFRFIAFQLACSARKTEVKVRRQ
jgi:hypothetical protein